MNRLYFLIVFILSGIYAQAQSLQTKQVNIINNFQQPARVFASNNGFGKTSVCPTDTVNFAYSKTTAFGAVTLNATSSGSVFSQWYPADQPMTVSGFDFYGWQSAGTSAVVQITCRIYNSTTDSLPAGTPLRTIVINVDSTFGGGLLSVLRKRAVFPTPVTVNAPYVLTVETSSSTNVSILSNSWNASPPNGRGMWLSSVKIGTPFIRSYNVNVGGIRFDADFILQPYVSYSLTAGFTPSTICNQAGNNITFTNTSSPVILSQFYSTRAFYNIPQFAFQWDFGDTSGVNYMVDGNKMYTHRLPYTVTLKDTLIAWMTGCGDTYSSTLSVAPMSPNAANNGPLCVGATLRLTADTVPGVTYYWTGPGGFTSTAQNPVIPSAGLSKAGLYTVRTVSGLCSSFAATTNVNIVSAITATNNGPLCAGSALNLTATNINGATYAWTGPNGFSSSLQAPSISSATTADSGTYTVTVALAGCGTLAPVNTTAVVSPVPGTPTVSNNGPLCVGNTLNLSASSFPGGSYTWTGPNSFTSTQQNPVLPNAQTSFAGAYTVTIKAGICSSPSATTNVTVNTVPSVPTAGNNGPFCLGQTLSLTASTVPGATYTWSGPNGFSSTLQNPTRTSLALADGGTYSVYASANGCSSAAATTSVTITTLTPTPVASSNGPLCPGQNLQLTASAIGGATYSWTGPNSFTSSLQNPTISNVTTAEAGTYSVTATTGGCGTSAAGSVTLTVNTTPAAPTLSSNAPLCDGDTLKLQASNVTGASYNWSGPGGFTSNLKSPAIPNVDNTKAGQYTCFVTVTGCGTSNTSTTNVNTHAVPSPPTATSNTPCIGDSLRLFGISFSVGPTAVYAWTGPNGFNSGIRNPVIGSATLAMAGTYNLTVKDSGCLSAPGSTVVSVNSTPPTPVATSNGPLCTGGIMLLDASVIPGATYAWTGPNGFTSSIQNSAKLNVTLADAGTYSVVATVSGCKSLPASTSVSINPTPQMPTASNNGPKCTGDNINLTASLISGVTYSWSGPGGFLSTQQNPVLAAVTPSSAGTYSVITVDGNCSSAPATTDVVVNNYPLAPTLSAYPGASACTGDSLQLFASFVNGATYDWTGPIGFGATVQNPVIYNVGPARSGQYTATVTKGGCTGPAGTINITVNNRPVTGAITGPLTVGQYRLKGYTVAGGVGSTYMWWVSPGASIPVPSTTSSVNVQWGAPDASAYVKAVETATTGCKGDTVKINVVVDMGVGEGELETAAGGIKMFPNPASKSVNLAFDFASAATPVVSIYDMPGRKVMESTVNVGGKETVALDVSSLQAGVYFVNVSIGQEARVMKLTIR